MGEISFAHRRAEVNAETWISAARDAARMALLSGGASAVEPALRDSHTDPTHPWASFETPSSDDVIWVAQVDGAAPAGTLVVTSEFGDLGVWRHPNDPDLPGLRIAVTPGGLASILNTIAPSVDAHLVEMITLQPLQRATLRIGRPRNEVFVKVVPPWRVERVADHHRRARAGGVPAPDVLHVDHSLGLIVFTALPGRTFAEHLEEGGPVPTADQIWQLIETISDAVNTHGDLHDRQILLDDHGHITGVVDFDDAGDGELLDDLARLLAHIEMRAVTHPVQRTRIEGVVRDLSTTFGERVDREALAERVEHFTHRLSRRRDIRSH